MTAKQVDTLATSLLNKTGIDDEVIKSGENMLLTFRNIRNEAGKGNDIFTQSTKLTTDLSVAMGKDMRSSAILVGKALNDPVKGLTALTRVGVSFTKGQQDQIKALAESGHAMQAQKIILGELNKEFGGSAEAAGKTLSGQLNILKETFRNTAGEVVSDFVPLFVKLAKVVLPAVGSAMKWVAGFISQFIKGFRNVGAHFSSASRAGWKFSQVLHGVIIPALKSVWAFIQKNVVPIIKQLRSIFVQSMTAIGKVVQQHGAQIRQMMKNVGAIIRQVAKAAIPILRFALVSVLPKAIGVALDATSEFIADLRRIVDFAGRAVAAVRGFANYVRTKVKGLAAPFAPLISALGHVKSILEWINDHTINIHINTPDIGGTLGHALLGAIPGVGGVTGLGDLLHRAGGGPVSAARPYIVGERGPELFMPRRAGTIVPNGSLGGGGDVNVNVTLGPDTMRELARVEVEAYGRKTARTIRAGRRV